VVIARSKIECESLIVKKKRTWGKRLKGGGEMRGIAVSQGGTGLGFCTASCTVVRVPRDFFK